ncbi:MAG TPA: hypothetical protein VJQ54_00195 [Candidatus Sulfotelmatobacter sp.]|nr:hypothetical protein [Candidatus Sulfotelmatobacter sp.]
MLPSTRQAARSIYFLVMCYFVFFTFTHVTMIFLTGLCGNLNHMICRRERQREHQLHYIWRGDGERRDRLAVATPLTQARSAGPDNRPFFDWLA